MKQCIEDMREKEVISISDGVKLGMVSDIEIDTITANLTALIVYGRPRFFGFFGRGNDIIIPWENVKLIGDDIVLVEYKTEVIPKRKHSIFSGLIEIK